MKLKIRSILKLLLLKILYTLLGTVLGAVGLYIYLMTNRPDLHPWHSVELDEEYTLENRGEITSFDDYLTLEKKLFQQLQTEIYNRPSTQPRHRLNRFDGGSLADPSSYPNNWNHSFIMKPDHPRGGVLLLHGLSDSPYSLRAMAKELYEQGYYVLGLRMPGHGTIPSGLVHASWQDMAAAVKLAAKHVSGEIGAQQPLYLFGYSMGAAQAVNYALDALQDDNLRQADAMVLISPAIGVSGVAALAVWQARLAIVPGLEKLAWNSIGPEYDPYKYTSFAVNAGDLMYRLTLEIDSKIAKLHASGETEGFPRTLVLLSLVDATVSTNAVVTHLLDKLDNAGNELVLYDINRDEGLEPFLQNDPITDYRALLKRSRLNFDLSLLTNESPESNRLVMHRRSSSDGAITTEETGLEWPAQIYSLSHVALPFSPTDSIYGPDPESDYGLHIGQLETKGERGVLNVPASERLRLRYNPFYLHMQQQINDFLDGAPPD